jgi:hypothetical protein
MRSTYPNIEMVANERVVDEGHTICNNLPGIRTGTLAHRTIVFC